MARAGRPCLGCPRIIPADSPRGRCPDCRREWDRARGTRQARGYDASHDRARAEIQARIDAGQVVRCWRCDVRLVGRAWHLDHDDTRRGYRGPACEPCNLSEAGKARHKETT